MPGFVEPHPNPSNAKNKKYLDFATSNATYPNFCVANFYIFPGQMSDDTKEALGIYRHMNWHSFAKKITRSSSIQQWLEDRGDRFLQFGKQRFLRDEAPKDTNFQNLIVAELGARASGSLQQMADHKVIIVKLLVDYLPYFELNLDLLTLKFVGKCSALTAKWQRLEYGGRGEPFNSERLDMLEVWVYDDVAKSLLGDDHHKNMCRFCRRWPEANQPFDKGWKGENNIDGKQFLALGISGSPSGPWQPVLPLKDVLQQGKVHGQQYDPYLRNRMDEEFVRTRGSSFDRVMFVGLIHQPNLNYTQALVAESGRRPSGAAS